MKARAIEVGGAITHLIVTTSDQITAAIEPIDDDGNPLAHVVHDFDLDGDATPAAAELRPHLEIAAGQVRVRGNAPEAIRRLRLVGLPPAARDR